MTTGDSPPSRERAVVIGCFAASLAWQLYVVATAFWKVPTFERLFATMGAELPLVTRVLFMTYRGWILVPIFFALLAFRGLRNRDTSASYIGILAGVCVATGFALQAWL